MLIYRNAEGVHVKGKFGNPWFSVFDNKWLCGARRDDWIVFSPPPGLTVSVLTSVLTLRPKRNCCCCCCGDNKVLCSSQCWSCAKKGFCNALLCGYYRVCMDHESAINYYYHWCRRRWCKGCNRTPKTFDLVKIHAKSVEIWAKFVKTFAKSLYVLWFHKNGTQNRSADVFFGRVFI